MAIQIYFHIFPFLTKHLKMFYVIIGIIFEKIKISHIHLIRMPVVKP